MIDKVYEDFTVEEKSIFPDESFFNNGYHNNIFESKFKEVSNSDEDILILGDADADGLCSAVIIRDVFNSNIPYIPCGHNGTPLDLRDGFKIASQFNGDTIIVEDICPDDIDSIKKLSDLSKDFDVKWFDHHKWDDDVYDFAKLECEEIVIDDSEDKNGNLNARCTAQIVRDFYSSSVSDKMYELADVVAEYDLWRLRDDRAYNLNYFALSDKVSFEKYLSKVQEYGPDIEKDDEVKHQLKEYTNEQDILDKMALNRCEFKVISGLKVVFTYGECRQSEISQTLRQECDCDLIIVLKPNGAGSLRGSKNFDECHLLARKLNGGGHPKAAGFNRSIENSKKLVNMWYNEGGKPLEEIKEIVTNYLIKNFNY